MAREININRDWRFFPGDLEPHTTASGWGGAKAKGFGFGAAKKDLDDSGWKQVNIPHDFVVERNIQRSKKILGITEIFRQWRRLIQDWLPVAL